MTSREMTCRNPRAQSPGALGQLAPRPPSIRRDVDAESRGQPAASRIEPRQARIEADRDGDPDLAPATCAWLEHADAHRKPEVAALVPARHARGPHDLAVRIHRIRR